jgi:hypothetical protein
MCWLIFKPFILRVGKGTRSFSLYWDKTISTSWDPMGSAEDMTKWQA